MLIECPACHTRVKLPDSKEGAKVRCPECARVYVARTGGKQGGGGLNTGLLIGIVAGAVAAIGVLLLISQQAGDPADAAGGSAVAAKSSSELPDTESVERWTAPAVVAAREVHKFAAESQEGRLQGLLDGERIFEARKAAGDELAAAFDAWGGMSELDRSRLLQAAVADLVSGADKGLIADWEPFDGVVVEEEGDRAVVHLSVSPRPGTEHSATESRTVRFELRRKNDRWLVGSWSRYQSPEELAAASRGSTQGALRGGLRKVEHSDGSVVLEKEPEPLGHLPDTHPDVAAEIDRLIAVLIDLDLTKESSQARKALVELGRPAIPRLLTVMYEIPLDTQEHAIQLNLVNQTLKGITGQDFGFKPQIAEGSGTGTTEERRQSAIKQWFAWWYREADEFVAKEGGADALGEVIELSPEDKDWLRRHGEKVD